MANLLVRNMELSSRAGSKLIVIASLTNGGSPWEGDGGVAASEKLRAPSQLLWLHRHKPCGWTCGSQRPVNEVEAAVVLDDRER